MIPGDIPQWIVLIWLFAFGSVVGSFLNVCIYRIPQHERLWDQLSGLTNPPSSCPFCKRRIWAFDNIPVWGWLALRGRCRFCRHWIPPRYALLEFFNGLLWVGLYMAIVPAGFHAKVSDSCLWSPVGILADPRLSHEQLVHMLNIQFFYYLILSQALVVATFIDFDLQVIPDGATVPAMIVGLIGAVVIGNLQPWPLWTQLYGLNDWALRHPHWNGLLSSILGMIVGAGTVWLVRFLGHWVWRREVMGDGDVVLMAMIGSFVGWQPALMVFFIAPFCGLITVIVSMRLLKAREIAYGPYLCFSCLLVLLAWKRFFSQFTLLFFEIQQHFYWMLPLMIFFLVLSLLIVRTFRSLLGFKNFDEDFIEEDWTSGDQLAFYANKDYESGCRDLKAPNWPGTASGQGRQFVDRWQRGLP